MVSSIQSIGSPLLRRIGRRAALAGLGGGLLSGLAGLALPARAGTLPLLPAALRRFVPPEPAPTVPFTTGAGQTRMLAAWRGDGIVLNLWATWCLPCKAEMPALDRLAQIVAASRIVVLPVSIDTGGRKAVMTFYRENRIAHLPVLLDPEGRMVTALKAPGVPTTVIIDRQGRMVGQVEGPVQWDAPSSVALLRKLVGAET
ncbi:MAG: TlpA disulfide reductase family protein [Rhodospirillales bacterium]|nr:TlpA disulfide reductase family protein [Rhodospirillales bacterium]